ncbi:hypothetical protein FORC36_1592 [Vibrio vulnificus]|nr:hypothetical protein FORC36_1592 [Vibrio vulnificus]
MVAACSFFHLQFAQFFRQISIVCQHEFRAVASIEFWACAMSASLVQSRFGSLAFALSFPKVIYQNLLVFKASERSQSLSQFGF